MVQAASKVGLPVVVVVFVGAGERVMIRGMEVRFPPSTTLTSATDTPKGIPGTSVVKERVSFRVLGEVCNLWASRGRGDFQRLSSCQYANTAANMSLLVASDREMLTVRRHVCLDLNSVHDVS